MEIQIEDVSLSDADFGEIYEPYILECQSSKSKISITSVNS